MDEAWDRKRVAEALVLLDRYQELRPDDRFAEVWRASFYIELHRFEEARALLLGCAEAMQPIEGGEGMWMSHWADLLHARGEFGEEEHYRWLLIQRKPDYSAYWIFLGSCLLGQGRLGEAREAYRCGTRCQGDPDEAWLNVGLVARALGEFEAARDAAVQALAITPDYREAERLLADVTAALELRGVQ